MHSENRHNNVNFIKIIILLLKILKFKMNKKSISFKYLLYIQTYDLFGKINNLKLLSWLKKKKKNMSTHNIKTMWNIN